MPVVLVFIKKKELTSLRLSLASIQERNESHTLLLFSARSFQQCDLKNAITIACHLALENLSSPTSMKIKVAELIDHFSNPEAPLVSEILLDVFGNLPLVQVSRLMEFWNVVVFTCFLT